MTDCFTEGSGQVIVRMIDRWQDHSDGLFLFTWSFISDWLSPKQFPVPCFCRLAGRFHVTLTGCHTCTLIQCYPHTWTGTHIHTCVIDWTGTILRVLLLGYFFFFTVGGPTGQIDLFVSCLSEWNYGNIMTLCSIFISLPVLTIPGLRISPRKQM